MRRLLLLIDVCRSIHVGLGFYNSTTKLDEDYYLNYDYELIGNVSEMSEAKSDLLILPNPETFQSKYTVDVLPKVDLPDDSLADTDLRDHDFIDNLMYVYYGSHNRNGSGYGSEIIIIGSVLSCAAQLLTIFCVLLRKNLIGKREINKMFLHLMGCLCLSNLVFMLGVYATKSVIKCQTVALLLHYLHLLTAFWIFLYCYYVYKSLSHSSVPKLKCLFTTAYGSPALLSVVSFLLAPKSYETKKFCFVSVQKGMLINYMLPISILIVITTMYSLNGIRKINLELSKLEMTSSAESLNMLRSESECTESDKRLDVASEEVTSLKECKGCLKVLCVIQTSYDVVWFTAVLALENVNYSNSMPIFYTIFSLLLNWYIFAKTKAFLPTIFYTAEVVADIGSLEIDKTAMGNLSVSASRRSSSDNVPLLVNSDLCTEMHELRQETISTISS
ncbi:hypothetical protein PPYR_14342 [Photinus pyralis]|uniref:G-protein coupled receptors family 2 profile 2 domain-containing protein n=2 Tax=Photinus pyralis TaxID=7054 RepID=A0A5N4A4Y2_PHOPY|nr:adhesion G protein-coupled receptor L3-like [Photinus pyralis]KAB0792383.1 hypothetical protein PPYR_14342 [Photinus pyralis]